MKSQVHRMPLRGEETAERLAFTVLSHGQHGRCFDWFNIDRGASRVGKARGIIKGKTLIICSITIFPEFEGHGYGKKAIEMFKRSFDTIIADRVRHGAIGFWVKMGFYDAGGGAYVYHKKKPA